MMRTYGALASAAPVALLLVAGCNSNSQSNAAARNEAASALNAQNAVTENAAVENEVAETGSGSSETVAAAPVPVAAVPVPVATSAPEAAPLVAAAAVSEAISAGRGIERIPYEDGWAWRRDGRIIRTASRDGRRVSYFRPGESSPYLVQQGDRAYAYSDGKPQRSYDRTGRPVALDQTHRQEGEQLARRAGEERTQAARVASEHADRVQREPALPDRPDARNGSSGPDRRPPATQAQDHAPAHPSSGNEASAMRPGNPPAPGPQGSHATSGRSPTAAQDRASKEKAAREKAAKEKRERSGDRTPGNESRRDDHQPPGAP